MSITDTVADLVIARWAPDEWLTIDDVVGLSSVYGITNARSTIQRTMQELRDRGILEFDYTGNYRRRPISEENGISANGQINDAQRLRQSRFADKPRLQNLVDERIRRLTAEYMKSGETSLRDVPAIIDQFEERRTEAIANVMTRLGQGRFRDELISYWGACAVTGCEVLPILRASHIKPWRVSTDAERLDVHNGLLLVPNLDALFDAGLISFDEGGRMIVSRILTTDNCKLFRVPSRTRIAITESHTPYLEYHREKVFVEGATNNAQTNAACNQ